MKEVLRKKAVWFEKKAREMGLTFDPINWEVVPEEIILEISAYGLPSHFSHWSYGQSYEYQKIQGEMGASKIYELVINNDPSYAFLLDTNPDIANIMVIAHVIGHCFAGDTLINTNEGPVEISKLNIGDMVETHTGEFKRVSAKKETKKTKDIVEIKIMGGNRKIKCTPEHKILIKKDEAMTWVEAKDITSDDLIPTPISNFYNQANETRTVEYSDDNYVYSRIESNRRVQLSTDISVWDIEVEDNHTFVLAEGMIAHNCHFFKNNYLFKKTDKKMVYRAAERAERIDGYINKYGIEKVEHIIDIALALEKNIDWHKGLYRKPYKKKERVFKKRVVDEFDDLYNKDKPIYKEVVVNENFPPEKEYDLLWFLANHADLEPWQKDIFEIVREESFYFYPQYLTKISNEGCASYIHAELMYLLSNDMLTSTEYMEFVKIHEKVVQPGSSKLDINPYFLGFTIFNDIKARWDEKYKNGESEIDGLSKLFEVWAQEDDISLLRNYLTKEIVEDLGMFTYRTYYDSVKNQYLEIKSTDLQDIVESQISKIYHYRAPLIYIEKASPDGLELVHDSTDVGTLDQRHVEVVCKYIHEIWGGVINIQTANNDGEIIHYTYDEGGFSHHSEEWDTTVM